MRSKRKQHRGFTLIEMLVVIAIIIILLATVVAIGQNIRVSSQVRQTKVTLKALETALAGYRAANNEIEPNTIAVLISSPEGKRSLSGLPSGTLTSSTVLDGFGNTITYFRLGDTISGTTTATRSFFRSSGPNGSPGDADDIFSYDP